jgi:hypothetical protein
MRLCIPEIALAISSIVKRSSNADFKSQIMTILQVSNQEEVQERLSNLMFEIASNKRKANNL